MAKAILMGRDGVLTVGGSTINVTRDVTVKIAPERGDTSSRANIHKVGSVVLVGISVEFECLNKASEVAGMFTAAAAGTPLAITTTDGAGHGIAGDYDLSIENGQPYKGEQTIKVTAEPNSDNGNYPSYA